MYRNRFSKDETDNSRSYFNFEVQWLQIGVSRAIEVRNQQKYITGSLDRTINREAALLFE
jgi:hypothetical protein